MENKTEQQIIDEFMGKQIVLFREFRKRNPNVDLNTIIGEIGEALRKVDTEYIKRGKETMCERFCRTSNKTIEHFKKELNKILLLIK